MPSEFTVKHVFDYNGRDAYQLWFKGRLMDTYKSRHVAEYYKEMMELQYEAEKASAEAEERAKEEEKKAKEEYYKKAKIEVNQKEFVSKRGDTVVLHYVFEHKPFCYQINSTEAKGKSDDELLNEFRGIAREGYNSFFDRKLVN